MMKRTASIAMECLVDLGVTVVYATLAGLVIAAVTVSDGGLNALLPALAYAALLPLAVLLLIIFDAGVRAMAERRAARRSPRRSTERFSGAIGRPVR